MVKEMSEEFIWVIKRISQYTFRLIGYIENESEIDQIKKRLEEKQKKEWSSHLDKYVYPQIKIEKIKKITIKSD